MCQWTTQTRPVYISRIGDSRSQGPAGISAEQAALPSAGDGEMVSSITEVPPRTRGVLWGICRLPDTGLARKSILNSPTA